MKESLIVVRGPIGVGKSTLSQSLRNLMPDHSSIVETDAIKRMIDPSGSSEWRRDVAHDSAAYIIERLLQVPRTGIIEAHTKYPEELDRFEAIAHRNNARLVNVLLAAPLKVCQERASERTVPGISYAIDSQMVSDYYCNMDPLPGDLVFDTVAMGADEIAQAVATSIREV